MPFRFALLLASALPITGSSPLSERAPTETPSPIPVQIVGDENLTMTGLVVSILAALIGAFAALASWRAANAAKQAAQTGERAAEYAALAANAAQKTAEYERATFNFTVDQERQRQALGVLVSWGGEYSGGPYSSGGVHVLVENTSASRITELQVWATKVGERITEVKVMQDLGKGSQAFDLSGNEKWFGLLHAGNGKGVLRFRDAAGLLWERRSGESPTSIDTTAPPP